MDNSAVDFDDWRKRLGREIRDCRDRLGWNQTELADMATPVLYPALDQHISKSTISGIENGTGNPTTDMLNAISVALEVEVKIKLRPIDKPEPPETKPSGLAQPHTPTLPTAEQVRTLLSDIPPPAEPVTNGDVEASNTRSRLARIGADLLSVIEGLEAGGQTPVARGGRSNSASRDRTNRRRKNRHPHTKATQKRR